MAAAPLRQRLVSGLPRFVQGFFDVVTVDTGPTPWLTGEFGAVFAAALVLTAWMFWRTRIEATS